MASEIELIYDDFTVELDAIDGMIASVQSTGGHTTAPRARIAGANAATLLLAATFEEFIRQTVKAVFEAKSRAAPNIGTFPDKIASIVWRRSLERMSRTPFDEIESRSSFFNDQLKATFAFCVTKDLTANVSDSLAHNDNNMRPGELNRLFNQIGLKNMCGQACTSANLIQFLGCENAGKAQVELESRLEDFFSRRNDIAHAIKLNSSSGPTSLSTDIALFRTFGEAIRNESVRFVTPPPPPPRSDTAPRRNRRRPVGAE